MPPMFRLGTVLPIALAGCVGSAPGAGAGPDAGIPVPDGAVTGADGRPGADPDAAPGVDAAPAADLLLDEPGCFFTVPAAGPGYARVIGEPGAHYRTLIIRYRVEHGGWREELFDRTVLNHNLLGLSRNVSASVGRYILGHAAQMKPNTAGYDRKSLMYGRVDLEPRPPGEGYTGYTSWRTPFAWRPGDTYQVDLVLDATTREQRLVVTAPDASTATTVGDIPYYDASLSAATFTLDLGGTDSDDREVRAVGWTFCDLTVEAIRE